MKQVYHLFQNILNGSFVNFAICEYYSDSIFTVLARTILTSIAVCDLNELRSYAKVDKRAHDLIL